MATKADILITAKDQATKVIERVTGALRGTARGGKEVAVEADALKAKWGALVASLREAGVSFQEIAQFTGLTRSELLQLGYTVEELTGLVEKQGVELMRMPTYVMGYRGGWLNLIATLIGGVSIFRILHQAIEKLWEPITKGEQKLADLRDGLTWVTTSGVEYAEIAREAEKETTGWQRAVDYLIGGFFAASAGLDRIITLGGQNVETIRKNLQLTREWRDAERERALAMAWSEEVTQALIATEVEAAGKVVVDKFEHQKEAIFATGLSKNEYIRMTRILIEELAKEGEALTENEWRLHQLAAAREYDARMIERQRQALEALWRIASTMQSAFEEMGDYIRDIGDIQDRYGDRTEDLLFRAAQAWESYQFRVGQAVDALAFRLAQMEAAFIQRIESMTARFNAAAAAAAARHALAIETITQDHYDRLKDMAWRHQDELRRLLGRAPWYLQQEIEKYQKERERLEKEGDKDALRRLDKDFMERMRRLDPHYWRELKRLKEEQQHERDIENREFEQRIAREQAQYAISRQLAQANYAIALADAMFAYQQQQEAAKFAHEQRLESMLFAYLQQKAASDRAYGEALEDQERALDEREEQFIEELKSWVQKFYYWGRKAGQAWTRGASEEMELPSTPTPPTSPPTFPLPPSTPFGAPPGPVARSGVTVTVELHGPFYLGTYENIRALAREVSQEIGREVAFRR